MLKISFKPWGKFRLVHDKRAIRRWLNEGADIVEKRFSEGVKNPPKTGKMRSKKNGGGMIRASVGRPGAEYPANDTGGLRSSIGKRVTSTEFEVGSNAEYSGYLRNGTRKMVRRKMSDSALRESIPEIRKILGSWARWAR